MQSRQEAGSGEILLHVTFTEELTSQEVTFAAMVSCGGITSQVVDQSVAGREPTMSSRTCAMVVQYCHAIQLVGTKPTIPESAYAVVV